MADPQKLRAMMERYHLMTPRQREIVERDGRNLQRALHGQPMPFYGADPQGEFRPSQGQSVPAGNVMVLRDTPMPDRELLQRNYEEVQKTLALGTAPPLSAAAKHQVYQWYKADAKAYSEGMPSHDQMWRATWQNLQLYQRHKAANVRRRQRLANMHKVLDPTDEGFHMELFRPDKPTPFNGASFRAGFDQIEWDDPTELQLQVEELDDATYYSFVELKAQGITAQRLFETQLGITPVLYRACEARLVQALAALELTETVEALTGEAVTLTEAVATLTGQEETPAGDGETLSLKEAEALDLYGAPLLALASEQAEGVTNAQVDALLASLTPGGFANRSAAVHVRLTTLRALQKSGLMHPAGDVYRVTEPTAA